MSLFDYRKISSTEDQRLLNASFCKMEFYATALYCFNYVFAYTAAILPINYRLTFNFYFEIFDIDEHFLANWSLNFVYQAITLLSLSIFYISHLLLCLTLMNQSCWLIDSTILCIKNLTVHQDAKNNKAINQNLLEIIELTGRVVKWHIEAGKFLRPKFVIEISMQSPILCMCFYTLMTNVATHLNGTLFLMSETLVCFVELFIYCWMGTRVNNHIEKLSAAIYEADWRLLSAKQQKDVKFVLMMAQNLRKFDGMFKNISLQSFKEVRFRVLRKFFVKKFSFRFASFRTRFWRLCEQ